MSFPVNELFFTLECLLFLIIHGINLLSNCLRPPHHRVRIELPLVGSLGFGVPWAHPGTALDPSWVPLGTFRTLIPSYQTQMHG